MEDKNSQEIIRKILYNKQIEENSSWNPKDKYYCENEDKKLINKYIKQRKTLTYNDFEDFYKDLYKSLKKRYHNNFYPEVMNNRNRIEYKLRGQAKINDIKLELIIRYTVKATTSHISLDVDFITQKNENIFQQEIKYVENYNVEEVEEKKGFFEKIGSLFRKNKSKNDDEEIKIPDFDKKFLKSGKKRYIKQKNNDELNQIFQILFNNYQFDSAIELLEFMNLSLKEYNAVKFFLEFYNKWDSLDYNMTPEIIVSFYETDLISPLVKQFKKNKVIIRTLRKEDNNTFLIIDLINNARRRFEQGLYNDSIIRLYRSLELISHKELFEQYEINPSNINIKKVKEYNVPKNEIYHLKALARNNITTLGMKEQYKLLSLLHNPLGKFFYDNKEMFDEIINMRNTSILIHGNTNLSSLQYQQYEYMVIQLASLSIKNFNRYFKYAKFPKYNR